MLIFLGPWSIRVNDQVELAPEARLNVRSGCCRDVVERAFQIVVVGSYGSVHRIVGAGRHSIVFTTPAGVCSADFEVPCPVFIELVCAPVIADRSPPLCNINSISAGGKILLFGSCSPKIGSKGCKHQCHNDQGNYSLHQPFLLSRWLVAVTTDTTLVRHTSIMLCPH